MLKEPKIFALGKMRTEKELTDLLFSEELSLEEWNEADEALFDLENDSDLWDWVPDGMGWNGDDRHYQCYKRVRKQPKTEIDAEFEEAQEFHKVNNL